VIYLKLFTLNGNLKRIIFLYKLNLNYINIYKSINYIIYLIHIINNQCLYIKYINYIMICLIFIYKC